MNALRDVAGGDEPQTGPEPKVHRIGADTRTHDSVPAGSKDGRRWPRAVRETVERIAEEERGDVGAVRRRLQAEHGLTVPSTTLRLWVRRRAAPDVPTVGAIAERALSLLSSEISALERASVRVDLDRLGKVAQTLKTLEGLSRRQAGTRRQTLSDLSAGSQTADEAEGVASRSQSVTTGLSTLDVDPSDQPDLAL